MALVSLADLRPTARFDEKPWNRARIESSADLATWATVTTIALDPLDEEPTEPQLRSLTFEGGDVWHRVVFLDDVDGEDQPSVPFAVAFPQFSPTLEDVGALLRARTYVDGGGDPDGTEVGTFNSDTRPTDTEVDRLIRQAGSDVAMRIGAVIPAEFQEDARHIVAMRTANLIELSYFPEQTGEDRTVYQSLRLTYEEEVAKLTRTLQWWALTQRLEEQKAARTS